MRSCAALLLPLVACGEVWEAEPLTRVCDDVGFQVSAVAFAHLVDLAARRRRHHRGAAMTRLLRASVVLLLAGCGRVPCGDVGRAISERTQT